MDVRFLIPPWERVEKTLGCPDPSGMRRPLAHVFALADSSKALLAVEEEGASPGQTQPTAPLFNVWFSGAWGAVSSNFRNMMMRPFFVRCVCTKNIKKVNITVQKFSEL